MAREDLTPDNLAKFRAYLATQGYEIRPTALSAESNAPLTNQTATKRTTQSNPASNPTPGPAAGSLAGPAASTKLTAKPGIARPAAPYSPYRSPRSTFRSRTPLISVPSPHQKSSKLVRPPIVMKYMKKPKGTVGRKGKYGWPQPLKVIFGVTSAEYQFIFSIIKRLVFKKLDTTVSLSDQEGENVKWVIQKTYKFIPEFKVYRGDWPIQAFIQSILKNSNYQHRKLVRRLETNQAGTQNTRATTDNNQMTDIADAANCIVDADSSDNEDPTKQAKNNTSMVSATNMTFEGIGATTPFAPQLNNAADDTSESDDDSNNFLRELLPPAIPAPFRTRPDRPPSNKPDPAPVQRPRPRMRPPPQDYATKPVSKSYTQLAAAAPTEQEPEPVPILAHSPIPLPLPSPSPEPQPKPAKQRKRNVPATSPTPLETRVTRAKASSQSEPEPESVNQVRFKGKGRSRKVPQPEPEPEPVTKRCKKTKANTGAEVERTSHAPPPAASAHSKTKKSGSATKEKAAPRSKQTPKPKGPSASSSRQSKVAEDMPESESELSDMSASKSNPPESSSDSGEEEEYEEEESHPVTTVTKNNSKKKNSKQPLIKKKVL